MLLPYVAPRLAGSVLTATEKLAAAFAANASSGRRVSLGARRMSFLSEDLVVRPGPCFVAMLQYRSIIFVVPATCADTGDAFVATLSSPVRATMLRDVLLDAPICARGEPCAKSW